MEKAKYAWKITYDALSKKKSGVMGPRNLDEELFLQPGEEFKMFDGDGRLYFIGTLHGEYHGLEPLDDYGRPGFGCTEIHLDDQVV